MMFDKKNCIIEPPVKCYKNIPEGEGKSGLRNDSMRERLLKNVSSCPSVSAVSTKSILIHEKAPPLRLTNHQSKTT